MRTKGLNAVAAAWLCFASLQAPFAHFHPEDLDHHHAEGLTHLHIGRISAHHFEDHDFEPEGPELNHADEDDTAILQEWTPAASQRITVAYAEVVLAPAEETLFEAEGAAPEIVVRSHDPPDLLFSPARAPPV